MCTPWSGGGGKSNILGNCRKGLCVWSLSFWVFGCTEVLLLSRASSLSPPFVSHPPIPGATPRPCPPQLEVGVGLQPRSQALCVFLTGERRRVRGPVQRCWSLGGCSPGLPGCRRLLWARPSAPGSSRPPPPSCWWGLAILQPRGGSGHFREQRAPVSLTSPRSEAASIPVKGAALASHVLVAPLAARLWVRYLASDSRLLMWNGVFTAPASEVEKSH